MWRDFHRWASLKGFRLLQMLPFYYGYLRIVLQTVLFGIYLDTYYAAPMFQMGQCLQDISCIKCGHKAPYSDMSPSRYLQQIIIGPDLTHVGVEGSIGVNCGGFWEVVSGLGNSFIC